jgi:ribosomal protein L30/L7E
MLRTFTEYLQAGATGDDRAFANRTYFGLMVGLGGSKWTVSPYNDGETAIVQPIADLYSLEELERLDLGPLTPVIEGLIYEAETIVVGGRPKVGKSRLIHQLSLALVDGVPFLGMTVPTPRRVLLLDLENGSRGLRDRLIKMSAATAAKDRLFVAFSDTLADPKFTNTPVGLAHLRDLLARTSAEILVIDPWRLWLGGDENDSAQVVNGLKALSELRRDHPSLVIVIVHHVRKESGESPKKLLEDPRLWTENLSGHHALMSHAHAGYGLERRMDEDEELIVFGGVARNVEPMTLILEEDAATLRFDVCRNEEAALKVMTPAERVLWKQAKSLGSFRFTDLGQASGSKNKKAISGMLKKAQEHGMLVKIGSHYKTG